MAAPTWFFISFMVLISLAICSAQPITVNTIKSEEADNNNYKAQTLSNIDVQRFVGRGRGDGFGIVVGGSSRSGFSIGGGGGLGIDIGGSIGIGIGGVVPGYGFPIYIPGFDFPVYSSTCGYVCPANNPNGKITEFKVSGLSHFTGPYRCRPGPNMNGDKDSNNELLLHTVSTMQDKREDKRRRLHYRRLGFGRDSDRGAGSSDTSDQYDTKDYVRRNFNGCGYVCPGNSPSGGINELHISGLSNFNGPYRCRPDVCDTEDCAEFLLHFAFPHQSEQQEEESPNAIPYPAPPKLEEESTNAVPYPAPPKLEEESTNAVPYPTPPKLEEESTNAVPYPTPPKLEEESTNAVPYPPPPKLEEESTNAVPYPPPPKLEEESTKAVPYPTPPKLEEESTKAVPYPPPPKLEEESTNAVPYPAPPKLEEESTNAVPYPAPPKLEEESTNAIPYPPPPKLEEESTNAIPYPPPHQQEEEITNASPYPPPPKS